MSCNILTARSYSLCRRPQRAHLRARRRAWKHPSSSLSAWVVPQRTQIGGSDSGSKESGTKDSGVISMAPAKTVGSCSRPSSVDISMESGANSSDVESAGTASMERRAGTRRAASVSSGERRVGAANGEWARRTASERGEQRRGEQRRRLKKARWAGGRGADGKRGERAQRTRAERMRRGA